MAALDRDMLKRCSKCKQEKPLEAFHLNAGTKDGRRYQCKDCHTSTNKAYITANRDRVNEKRRIYRAANKNRINELQRAHLAKNRNLINERQRAKRAANRNLFRERDRAHYAANKNRRKETRQFNIRNASDTYIKRLLTERTTLHPADIPDWLVEAKRAQLLLKREANK